MKIKLIFFAWSMLFVSLISVSAQKDKRLSDILETTRSVNEKVADCDANGKTSSTFLTEITFNKNNGSYPAIGVLRSSLKIYFTFGNREADPYPNRILKVIENVERSSRVEKYEYIFNRKNELVSYSEKTEDGERQIYFSSGIAFGSTLDGKNTNLASKSEREKITNVKTRAKQIVSIFENSFP